MINFIYNLKESPKIFYLHHLILNRVICTWVVQSKKQRAYIISERSMDPEQCVKKQVTPIKMNLENGLELNTNHKNNPKSIHEVSDKIQRIDINGFQQQKFVTKQNMQSIPNQTLFSRKKVPDNQLMEENKAEQMNIQNTSAKMAFKDLPLTVSFYLTDVYQQYNKLFLSGIMENGQTITIMSNNSLKDLYFCLKREKANSEVISQEFKMKAQKQIDERLGKAGIKIQYSQWVQKSYCFEIEQIPRQKRPYYRVRYLYKQQSKQSPKPDWEGQTFKYVFGTTYTPLQTFVINTGIQGPQWVQVDRDSALQESKNNTDGILCAEISNVEMLEVVDRSQAPKVPKMRVMSIAFKAITPIKVKIKKLFNTMKTEEEHIYTISYQICESYDVEVKPAKPNLKSKTFYLRQFGKFSHPGFQQCNSEFQMFERFAADVKMYDPDLIVCHDAATVIGFLQNRMNYLGRTKAKPKFSRFIGAHEAGEKASSTQKMNSFLAGRLIVDTFNHSKELIKEVDYSLESMTKHIKPAINFKAVTEENAIQLMNEMKVFFAINAATQQAQAAFALMNHLEIIQQTRAVTNICGNTWKRSLQQQRAERNEFLIMHQCMKRDIIIPDKFRIQKGGDEEIGDKKKFVGGLVLNPITGMYNDFILLLDFNSLYPSLIRQYNICFSKIKRPLVPFSYYYKSGPANKKQKNKVMEMEEGASQTDFKVEPPPKQECQKSKWGFLPYLIDKIVQKRKMCKKQMKNAAPDKVVILDIQQKSYKIVANSIYGCLGFKFNRFYSKDLAALVTQKGREALMKAKEIVESRDVFRVIYGDTDSLMIQPKSLMSETNKQKIFELKDLANDLKKEINKQYRNLEIDIDGIYKPIILLQKKKYVANMLKNYQEVIYQNKQPVFAIEYKGVEVVRRDGCQISRKVLKQVIGLLMKGENKQLTTIQQEIVEYFQDLQKRLQTIDFKNFLLANVLSKKPSQYANGDHIAHVKVAKDRIRNGEKQQSLIGHMMYYVVCLAQVQSQDNFAKRSWDDLTFEKSRKNPDPEKRLKIDMEYYKQQILRPVARILGTVNIEMERIFDAMKIQTLNRERIKKFVITQQGQDGSTIMQTKMLDNLLDVGFSKGSTIQQQIGKFKCSCGQQDYSVLNGNTFRILCPKCQKKNFISTLTQKIQLMISNCNWEVYDPKFRCKCQKSYVTKLSNPCCRLYTQKKIHGLHLMHNTLYLILDVAKKTRKQLTFLVDRNMGDKRHLEKINRLVKLITKKLQQSKFEDISQLMSKVVF